MRETDLIPIIAAWLATDKRDPRELARRIVVAERRMLVQAGQTRKGNRLGRPPHREIDFKRVAELREQMWSWRGIAAEIGVPETTLRNAITRMGKERT